MSVTNPCLPAKWKWNDVKSGKIECNLYTRVFSRRHSLSECVYVCAQNIILTPLLLQQIFLLLVGSCAVSVWENSLNCRFSWCFPSFKCSNAYWCNKSCACYVLHSRLCYCYHWAPSNTVKIIAIHATISCIYAFCLRQYSNHYIYGFIFCPRFALRNGQILVPERIWYISIDTEKSFY